MEKDKFPEGTSETWAWNNGEIEAGIAKSKEATWSYLWVALESGEVKITKIHPTAKVDSTAKIHPSVVVPEGCVIWPNVIIEEGAVLGRNVHIWANTEICKKVRIWNNVIIQSDVSINDCVVIGSEAQIWKGAFIWFLSIITQKAIICDWMHVSAYSTINREGESDGFMIISGFSKS